MPVRKTAWLCGALVLAGCTLPTGSGKGGATGATGASRPAPVTPAATKAPGGNTQLAPLSKEKARQKGIVSAIQSTLVAGDLARSQNTLQLISDNGLGLISDNGLGLISDNGLGLISDNGLGFRVLAAGAIRQAAEVYYENEVTKGGLTWVSTFYKPDYRGEIRAYPEADYAARKHAATPAEHYTWDALGIDLVNPTFPLKYPLDAKLTYKITPKKSARFTFIKRMNLLFNMTIQQLEPPPAKVVHNGFSGAYDMEVPLADGTKEIITMEAYDMVYEDGKGLGGPSFYAPKSFKAKGENDGGKLEMAMSRQGDIDKADALTMDLEATHTAKEGGRVSRLKVHITEANAQTSTVTDVTNGVEATLEMAPDRTGSGEVRLVGSTEVLGTITWGNDGLGTIKFSDGAVEKVRVF
jgi:hypothetical protein